MALNGDGASWTSDAGRVGLRDGPTSSELAARLGELEALALTSGETSLGEYAREARRRVEAGEVWLVVVGQFKRGKTSLINRLLGEDLLPTGVIPVTSVATVLRRGRSVRLTVHFEDGTTEGVEPGALATYVTEEGNPSNRRGVARVEVRHPSDFLADGVVLVDTPGVGSLSAATTEHAYGWLPRIDAALVVLSPDPPLGAAEAEYVRDVAERTRHVVFAFNKVDLYAESTWVEALAYHRKILAELLNTELEDVLIQPTCSRPQGPVGQVGGGAGELKDLLRRYVAEAGSAAARAAAVGRVHHIQDALRAHLELERAAILTPAAELARRLEGLRGRRGELRRRRKDAEAILHQEAGDLVRRAEASLNEVVRVRAPHLSRLVVDVAGRPVPAGNLPLARAVSRAMTDRVEREFETWWGSQGAGVRDGLRAAMHRVSGIVEESMGELRTWIEGEFGVTMGRPPALRPLVDSTDFYYRVDGPLPRTTLGSLGLMVPRPLFRWALKQRAPALGLDEMTRNAGRIRGDLQYRLQETVRAFLSQLRRSVEADEVALETALIRGAELQASGGPGRARALASVDERLQRLDEGRDPRGHD